MLRYEMLRFAQHDTRNQRASTCHAERSEAESKHLIPKKSMRTYHPLINHLDDTHDRFLFGIGGQINAEEVDTRMHLLSGSIRAVPLRGRNSAALLSPKSVRTRCPARSNTRTERRASTNRTNPVYRVSTLTPSPLG